MMAGRWWLAVALVGVTLGGCNGKRGDAPAASSSTATSAPTARGKAAAGNDPAVLALLEPALGCPWTDGVIQRECEALRAWEESKLFEEGKADTTLLNLIEDERESVRFLAAGRLQLHGKAYRQDKAMAQRVLGAAAAENATAPATELGAAVAGIDLAATGLAAEAEKLMQPAAPAAVRRAVIARVLTRNPTFYERVKAIASSDSDREIRLAALSGFWAGTPPTEFASSCKFWRERAAADPDDAVAAEAAYLASLYPQAGGCQAEYDALLELVETKAKDGKVQSAQLAAALANLHGQAEASDAQKKRAIAAAKTLLENASNGEFARARALGFLGEKDADGKAVAKKYKDDSQPAVKSAAEKILG